MRSADRDRSARPARPAVRRRRADPAPGRAGGLTSRAVTAEAGCAKGVLHRHFADFDDFLAQLVLGHILRMADQADALRAAAGTGTVAGLLTSALTEVFGPVALGILALVTFRDDLRARLRLVTPAGLPVLTEAAAMIAVYLGVEQDLGRVAPDADVGTLALTLIGTGHLLLAGQPGTAPDEAAVRKVVAAVLAGAAPEPPA